MKSAICCSLCYSTHTSLPRLRSDLTTTFCTIIYQNSWLSKTGKHASKAHPTLQGPTVSPMKPCTYARIVHALKRQVSNVAKRWRHLPPGVIRNTFLQHVVLGEEVAEPEGQYPPLDVSKYMLFGVCPVRLVPKLELHIILNSTADMLQQLQRHHQKHFHTNIKYSHIFRTTCGATIVKTLLRPALAGSGESVVTSNIAHRPFQWCYRVREMVFHTNHVRMYAALKRCTSRPHNDGTAYAGLSQDQLRRASTGKLPPNRVLNTK